MLFLDGRVGIYLFIYFFSFLKSMTIRKRKFEGRIIEVLNRFSFSIRRFPPFDCTVSCKAKRHWYRYWNAVKSYTYSLFLFLFLKMEFG